ncbi:MAG: hypothetical protein P1V81_06090 [Planctomycetota bacterium]|nr:hypothetical protein [Planctomycetota bacterium]
MLRTFVSASVASLLLATPAIAQDYDVIPAYHPEGPDAGQLEVYLDADLTIQVSLPGLTHEASKPLAPTHLTFLAVAVAALPVGIPLGPSASLWLDPAAIKLIPIGSSLELQVNLASDPALVDGVVPTQVFDVDLLDPALTLFGSGLIEARLLAPVPDHDVRMLPLGSDAAGTESVTFDAGSLVYKFTFTDASSVVTEYQIDLKDPGVQQGTINVFEASNQVYPAIFGGFHYGQNGVAYNPLAFQAFGTHTLLGHSLSGNTLRMDFQDDVPAIGGGTTTHTRSIEYTLVGKSLKVHAYQTSGGHEGDDGYCGFSLGNQASLNPSSTFEGRRVPYMDQIGISLLDDTLFMQSFLDLFESSAQRHAEAALWTFANLASFTEVVHYIPDTDQKCLPLDETGWLTVSPDVSDCFVRTNATKGTHGDDFANMVAVAYSKELTSDQAYNQDLANVQAMQSWGMKDVLMWKTHWMHFGHNRRASTHVPANPVGGTDAELAAMVQQAVAGGWRVAMYTDFYSLDQAQGSDENPNYSEVAPDYIHWDDSVKDGKGKYRLGFGIVEDLANPHSNLYHTRLLAPRRVLKHFEREAAIMMANYGVNANYFDVMTISAPDLIVTGNGLNQGVISGDHTSPNDNSLSSALNSYADLFEQASNFIHGPVLGEGSFWLFERRWDTFYMGYLDGAWRTLSTGGPPSVPSTAGENQVIVPDYEINVVRPVMPGLFGMGQYTRYFQGGTHPVPYSDATVYSYRAASISYGHNGFMMSLSVKDNGDDYLHWASQIKEYYAMRYFPEEWNAATGATVEYRAGDQPLGWMDLSTAYKTDLDLTQPVVRLTYDNGLVVVVNHSGVTVTEGGYTIPFEGWTAINPSTGYQNLSVIDATSGSRIDHVVCPDYEMADGNGVAHDFGGAIGTTTDLKVVIFNPAKTLTEQPNGNIQTQ